MVKYHLWAFALLFVKIGKPTQKDRKNKKFKQ
jgi:hypothetical protein